MDGNVDKRLMDEIQSLYNRYGGDSKLTAQHLRRRLIINRVFGYLAIAGTCGWTLYLIGICTGSSCLATIGFLLMPIFVCFILSIIFVYNIVNIKKMIRALQINKN